MARCVTCGSELHPERAEKYDYCTKRECRERNAKPLTIAAVAVNKAADQYLVVNERTKADLAAGKYQDQRKSSSVTDGRPLRRTPAAPRGGGPHGPPAATPAPQAGRARAAGLDEVAGGPGGHLQRPGDAARRDRRTARGEPLCGHPHGPRPGRPAG